MCGYAGLAVMTAREAESHRSRTVVGVPAGLGRVETNFVTFRYDDAERKEYLAV
jgi:hypothetical protein